MFEVIVCYLVTIFSLSTVRPTPFSHLHPISERHINAMQLENKLLAETRERLDFDPIARAETFRDKRPRDLVQDPATRQRRFLAHCEEAPDVERAQVEFERIINGNDLTSINYLEKGTQAARAVGRVHLRSSDGTVIGYGTGFLIGPGVLMTNHHVLEDKTQAANAAIEFDYELDMNGKAKPTYFFKFKPDALFFTDSQLDFSVVAVDSTSDSGNRALAKYGWLPLNPLPGKALLGEYLTIIQHPGGQRKQVCVRENQLLQIKDDFVWYATDTSGGSSGSPVFNGSWQVVALHHSGVPEKDAEGNSLTVDGTPWDASMDESRIKWIANEGVRVSRIVETLKKKLEKHPLMKPIVDQLKPLEITSSLFSAPLVVPSMVSTTAASTATPSSIESRGDGVVLSVPIEITLRLGAGARSQPQAPSQNVDRVGVEEKVSIDPNYSNRRGYDDNFLGNVGLSVPLPKLSQTQLKDVALLLQPQGANRYVLHYHHYSVVMNARRKLAFFTAVNIDGARWQSIKREKDSWYRDPRIAAGAQTGEALYAGNPLDRGHLVRRLDPAWGPSEAVAKVANDDTFHFTNCSPQHEDFNQNSNTWAGLEDYILFNAAKNKFRACVFSGPVLAPDDEPFNGVQLPRQFWKVAVMVKDNGKLSATGYLLSQAKLIAGLVDEAFTYAGYKTFQVSVRKIEKFVGLDFGTLRNADPLKNTNESVGVKEIVGLEQIRL